MAAVGAAIAAYIEEEARLVAISPRKPPAMANLWVRSGREEMMRMRTLLQRRVVPARKASKEVKL